VGCNVWALTLAKSKYDVKAGDYETAATAVVIALQ
jgi:hypothetical protein